MKNVSTMKNGSTLKTSGKLESPKTPGGISKSLLTPCRRIGLSRNWRKGGVSPFVSPLAVAEDKSEKTEITPKRESRKRKDRCGEESTVEKSQTPLSKDEGAEEGIVEVSAAKTDDIKTTPSRIIVSPRKKSKTLLANRIISEDDGESPKTLNFTKNEAPTNEENVQVLMETDISRPRPESDIATPIQIKSVSKASKFRSEYAANYIECKENSREWFESEDTKENTITSMNNTAEKSIKKSPDNLTKGCVVVIQKKLYKKDLEILKQKEIKKDKKLKKNIGVISQTLFDSDSDDVPLSVLNKKEDTTKDELPKQDRFDDDDDDFTETKKIKIKKLVDKTTSIGGLPSDLSNKKKSKHKKDMIVLKPNTSVEPVPNALDSKLIPSTQSSIDDDDFVIDSKRTILIKKSYSKVTKPEKAKSTGSITQRDIDDLKARIEIKKKLLLAKAVSPDTKELRDLIKKWQKGCQDALMELMELMKTKLPDKQNMDYAEILQTLKIPPALVGYDEDNDCFNTPTDENIILSKFNDT